MSIDDINEAATALNSAAEQITGFMETADEQLSEVASRYGNGSAYIYLDQSTGDYENAGTQDAPVATLGRALDLCVSFRSNFVYIRGNYTTTERYTPKGLTVKFIGVLGDDWESPNEDNCPDLIISFDFSDDDLSLNGFETGLVAILDIYNMNLVLPSAAEISAQNSAYNLTSVYSAAFPAPSSAAILVGSVTLRYGALVVPSDFPGTLLSNHIGGTFHMYSATIDGDIAGLVHPEIAAGTANTAAFPYVITNLNTL